MENKSFRAALKKNAMLIVLVLVYLFFLILTQGGIFKPSSFTELINQNAYVYILGAGMLMCMLTGGNIDLSCGAFVCLLGAFGGVFMIVMGLGTGLSILLLLLPLKGLSGPKPTWAKAKAATNNLIARC